MSTVMDCLAEDTILEFIEGRLCAAEVQAVEDHIDHCPDCRLLVAEAARCVGAGLDDTDPGSSRRAPAASRSERRPSTDHRSSSRGGASGSLSRGEALRPGELLAGRYRVVRFLGAGAMGAVYEALDEELDEPIAVKVLRPELAGLPQLLERLCHEVVLGRRITHPNVCRLHDIGSCDGRHFITMELVRGESLDALVARGPARPSVALSILLQTCAALEAAHQKGVVHRDLKPGNIMIDWTAPPTSVGPAVSRSEAGKVTVMDFGLARDLHGERSQSGMLIGSPAYWAPEQARGERATERSDIYAVGVIACELLGAPRPALGKPGCLAEVPAPLRSVLQRCLESLPERRHASAGALSEALAAAARAAPTRRRLGWAAASALTLAVAAVASYLLLAWVQGRGPARTTGPQAAVLRVPTAASLDAALLAPSISAETVTRPSIRIASGNEGAPAAAGDAHTGAALAAGDDADRGGAPAMSGAGPRAVRRGRAQRAAATRIAGIEHPPPRSEPPSPPALSLGTEEKTEETSVAAPAAALPAAQAAASARTLVTVRKRLEAVEQNRRARGLLPQDIEGYPGRLRAVEQALSAGLAPRAREALDALSMTLGGVRVDGPFISRKLARLNELLGSSKLDPERTRQVRAAFAQVHSRYFAGDYQAANQHLNAIWRLLGRGGHGAR